MTDSGNAPDFPQEGIREGFEITILEPGYERAARVYKLIKGGRRVLISAEGQVSTPLYGMLSSNQVDLSGIELPLAKFCLAESRLSSYDFYRERLAHIVEVVRTLYEKKETWGIHIDNILAFYRAVKGQSDQLIEKLKVHHPEFEEYRLPDISEHDKESMRAVARRALRNALENV